VTAITVTQGQVDRALERLLKHVAHARSTGFIGDDRERSSDIRRSVHRLDDAEIRHLYQLIYVIGRWVPHTMIPREKRKDLYDVSHAIRGEYWDRDTLRKKG
jgi:hypothetical protein